jgi:pre-mRNA-splicing factor 18
MDLVKREMERKRRVLQEAKHKMMEQQQQQSITTTTSTSSSSNNNNNSKDDQHSHRSRKYMKTTEIRRILEDEEEKEAMARREKGVLRQEMLSAAKTDHRENSDDGSEQHLDNGREERTGKKRKLSQGITVARVNPDTTSDGIFQNNQSTPGTESNVVVQQVVGSQQQQQQQHDYNYTLDTVQQELRRLGLPISYFGEGSSIKVRVQRLHDAQKNQTIVQLQEREANEFRLQQGFGIRNTFLEKEDTTALELHDHNNNLSSTHFTTTEAVATNRSKGDKNNLKNDKDIEKKHPNNPHTSTTAPVASEEEDNDDQHKRIYKHFKGLLKQWEHNLNERSDDVKRSLAGRNETKKVKQCKDYIRPLFQLCKRRQLDTNMAQKLYDMVVYCERGEFVMAHGVYMDIAIGRAAWPIGVTMVGIHARTGRAKIESSNVAHVMNSELQRKYLTSVKRLLTYEQNQRTDVDPSKKVR